MGVTPASTTASSIIATMTRPKMGTFVPPFMADVTVSTSVPTSPHPQVRPRLDDWYVTMLSLFREQPYGMQTSMTRNLHNNVSAPADHVNPFTPFNTHSPSSSSIFGISSLPTITT